jgi:hypothetical protein
VAVKLTHKATGREVRFGNQDSARRYAEEHGGGLVHWTLTTTPRPPAEPGGDRAKDQSG